MRSSLQAMIDMPLISPRVGADKAPTEKTTIRLDPERKAQVMKWGDGNASAGIRFAIDQCNEIRSGGMDPRRQMLSVMMLPANATDQRVFIEIMESVLRFGDGFLTVKTCQGIVRRNEKNPDRGRQILRWLVRDRFLAQSDAGYRPIMRSKQIVNMDRFREILRDYCDYLKCTGKFGNVLDSIDE